MLIVLNSLVYYACTHISSLIYPFLTHPVI